MSLLNMASEIAKMRGEKDSTPEKGPWIFTLDAPCVTGILSYCDERDLRYKMYRAYVTRSSEFSLGDLKDNLPVLEKIREYK